MAGLRGNLVLAPGPVNRTSVDSVNRFLADLDPRHAAALSYLAGFVSAALVLWRRGEDPFVRFHAWQSILFSLALATTLVGVELVPLLGLALVWAIATLGALAWIGLMVQAFRGVWTLLPLLGDVALERSRSD